MFHPPVAHQSNPHRHFPDRAGWRGLLHALVVPIATAAIDHFAYEGTDARKLLHDAEFPADSTVVDLASGVGFSPARNGKVTCVDTSQEMLTVARLRRPDVQHFECGNAEEWGEVRLCRHHQFPSIHPRSLFINRSFTRRGPSGALLPRTPLLHASRRPLLSPALALAPPSPMQTNSFDIATLMFATHEMPGDARRRCIRNALRLARDKVMIVDIWPGFEPNDMMLSGEPYVLNYLENIESDVDSSVDTTQWEIERVDVVPQHVRMWKFTRLDWGI